MELSDDVLCLFSGVLDQRNGSYVIEVPERELTLGTLESDTAYGVAVISQETISVRKTDTTKSTQQHEDPEPPVAEGEHRTVDISDIGDQGDGIARVERGYVVIVPDTELNERVEIEITDVTQTVAFGEVIEREEYYQ
ncbi:translation initiation factor IF-2 subunit beta [Halalkalicoccus paucihalophilus]|uniref:Translation initiation factor IF-2 subunit beta n=1 Tax=Halalkalicoccus paucihalophilus TaxID=1008153 RepID=A0A151A9H8_9EURY|nr:TRAM domain-containing protein [Halalkalicoccus paucihalophilus]KYH24269.1 translation initiation factor IF-2 subunit beta [Halalkalicoccus paucihalophilus]